MHHARLLALALTALLGAIPVACSRKGPAAAMDSGAARADAAPTALGATDAASSATTASGKRPSPISTAKVPLDKAAARAYADALRTGRKETVAKRWDAAIAAFDAALRALPRDARALSERGHAKLLAGRLEPARQDLREAESLTKDPKLLAQIHYNHGLVAEKLGRPDEARGSFARSNALAPTKAAAAKLGGKSCEAVVEIGRGNTVVVKDWLGMYDALRPAQSSHDGEVRPATDAAAKDRLCSRVPLGRCTDLAGFSEQAELTSWSFHPVLKVPEGFLVGRDELSSRFDLPCGGDENLDVKDAAGLRVLRLENATGMRIPVCEADGGELAGCGPDDVPVSSACGRGAPEVTVVIFDLVKNRLLATVRHSTEGGKKAPTVTVTGRTLQVTGGGCDVKSEL